MATVVQVNGVEVAEVPAEPVEAHRIIVPAAQLPAAPEGLYIITMETNGEYNVKKAKDADEKRSLSSILKYAGPVRRVTEGQK